MQLYFEEIHLYDILEACFFAIIQYKRRKLIGPITCLLLGCSLVLFQIGVNTNLTFYKNLDEQETYYVRQASCIWFDSFNHCSHILVIFAMICQTF